MSGVSTNCTQFAAAGLKTDPWRKGPRHGLSAEEVRRRMARAAHLVPRETEALMIALKVPERLRKLAGDQADPALPGDAT